MSTNQKTVVNIFLQLGTVISVLSMFFYIGSFTSDAKHKQFDTSSQKEAVIRHYKNKRLHMPLEKKQVFFVPRVEYNLDVGNIKEDVAEMKADLKDFLKEWREFNKNNR